MPCMPDFMRVNSICWTEPMKQGNKKNTSGLHAQPFKRKWTSQTDKVGLNLIFNMPGCSTYILRRHGISLNAAVNVVSR